MRLTFFILIIPSILAAFCTSSAAVPEKEFLTEKEIIAVRKNQEIASRVRIYMEAAALRLKSAEERLNGKESAQGDPFEFFTPEDMLEGYSRILKSAMYNLDDASQRRDSGLTAALKALKGGMEDAGDRLQILKKIAEDKKKERLGNLVDQAVETTDYAHERAERDLSGGSSPKK
jgi:hypothetical protein